MVKKRLTNLPQRGIITEFRTMETDALAEQACTL